MRTLPENRGVKLFILLGLLILLSGFDTTRHSIPLDEIRPGGPPKNGIPSIDRPRFLSAKDAPAEIKPGDRVLGLTLNGEARAYPIAILNWHEIVNDTLGGQAVVITYCPLCGTGMVFDAQAGGERLSFGVSGLLYQSDVLLYDRKTESLWSQIKAEAVAGKMTGTKLHLLPSTHTTWAKWIEAHPGTQVLSRDTGHRRDYDHDPYYSYANGSGDLMFDVSRVNPVLPLKEIVIGIRIGEASKAYAFSDLEKAAPVSDRLGRVAFTVHYDSESRTALIRDTKGKELPTVVGYWFAWFAFHPETQVFKENQSIHGNIMKGLVFLVFAAAFFASGISRKKLALVVLLVAAIALFYYFDLARYLTLEGIKDNLQSLQDYYARNTPGMILGFIGVYIVVVALSLPGASLLTLTAGAVFGSLPGTLVVNVGATVGAALAFLAARFVLRDWVENRFGEKIKPFNEGFSKNALNYILFLRLVPVFPFVLVNLLSGLTQLRFGTYFIGTMVGILPGSFVYANAGSNLASIDSLSDVVSAPVLGAFALLGLFALIPTLYNHFKNRKTAPKEMIP